MNKTQTPKRELIDARVHVLGALVHIADDEFLRTGTVVDQTERDVELFMRHEDEPYRWFPKTQIIRICIDSSMIDVKVIREDDSTAKAISL